MVGELDRHSGSALVVNPSILRHGQWNAKGKVVMKPIVFKEDRAVEPIPCLNLLGKAVRLPGQAVQAIAQNPVQPLQVDGVRLCDRFSDCRPNLDPHQSSSLPMLHRLGDADPGCWPQDIPAGVNSRWLALAVDRLDRLRVRRPAVTHERNTDMPPGPLPGSGHDRARQRLHTRAARPRHDESTRPILAQSAPAFARLFPGRIDWPRLGTGTPFFFPTNDQNSSSSTSDRSKSWTSKSVTASACAPIRRIHSAMVS